MNNNLPHILDRFADLRVVVLGDAMLDSYLHGASTRLCREAPVPIVDVERRDDAPGGAANTAVNVACLGANATFLSIIGDDAEGHMLRRALETYGVETAHLLVDGTRRTLAKTRVLAGTQMVVRYDQGSTDDVDAATERALIERLVELAPACDVLIVSDYGYGILTPKIIHAIGDVQRRFPRVLAVDAKNLRLYRNAGVTAVKPNYGEATALLGVPREANGVRVEQMADRAHEIFELTGAQIAAVTLDCEGALILERGAPAYRTYAQPQPDSHAAGAGDTFLSTLALALGAGAHTHAAAELASAAASIVVSRGGTTACALDELRAQVTETGKYVVDVEQLAKRIELHRRQGKRVVFTNGCFDILHRGHVTYLNRAKALGDLLILGLNSDESVQRLKGPTRPINALADRAQVLDALSCIDYIVPFDENTPARLIDALRPDIYVKGGDYTRETLPEAPQVEALGGEVQILQYLDDFSTTSIIERIREVYA